MKCREIYKIIFIAHPEMEIFGTFQGKFDTLEDLDETCINPIYLKTLKNIWNDGLARNLYIKDKYLSFLLCKIQDMLIYKGQQWNLYFTEIYCENMDELKQLNGYTPANEYVNFDGFCRLNFIFEEMPAPQLKNARECD